MFERAYRQRLEADLARWQSGGVIAPDVGEAIRKSLGPLPRGINIATVIGILGGLLIAAAFLAFVAANWTTIARPARFLILLGGIAGAYGFGSLFARTGRPVLADISVTVGSIVFGAAIALVGQMYHLGEDFAGGMLLWSLGALIAAVTTGSRGALAVALVSGCLWSGMRVFETYDAPHLPFVAFWLVGAALALAWNAALARHLVALAALVWWIVTDFGLIASVNAGAPSFGLLAGGALMLGAGLALASLRGNSLGAFGLTLSTYGAFGLALAAPTMVINFLGVVFRPAPSWLTICAAAGAILALAAAAIGSRPGPILAALSAGLVLVVMMGYAWPVGNEEPWLAYAVALAAMLCLVVSGMLDEVRPRVVAGWLGLGFVIAAITWAVKGSLLRRSVFLALAGGVAIGLAMLLGRFRPGEAAR